MGKAKVTVYLDDKLAQELRHLAVDKRVTLSSVAEDLLRSGMRRAKTAGPPPHHPEPPPVPKR